jgi:hypothetical protein
LAGEPGALELGGATTPGMLIGIACAVGGGWGGSSGEVMLMLS